MVKIVAHRSELWASEAIERQSLDMPGMHMTLLGARSQHWAI